MTKAGARKRKTFTKTFPVVGDVLQIATNAIADADYQAALDRVSELRKGHPSASRAELVALLTRKKCLEAGKIGAITSGASIIPGLGTVASLTFGVAADIGLTFKLQAELVLEIAAVYGHSLDETEKRNAVLLVTGISAGANKALEKTGAKIAQKTTERLARKSLSKAIPVFGAAASAGTNILTTYIIGRRANAYFSLGPGAVGDWGDSLRAVSGIDERELIAWLSETTEGSWTLVKDRAQNAAGLVIVAGKTAGEVVVVGADRAAQSIARAGRSIAAGATRAGQKLTGPGKTAAEGTRTAATSLVEKTKQARERVPAGTDAAKNRFSEALKRFRREDAGKDADLETKKGSA
jgi:uncharacterized protein (DUF697 family)